MEIKLLRHLEIMVCIVTKILVNNFFFYFKQILYLNLLNYQSICCNRKLEIVKISTLLSTESEESIKIKLKIKNFID